LHFTATKTCGAKLLIPHTPGLYTGDDYQPQIAGMLCSSRPRRRESEPVDADLRRERDLRVVLNVPDAATARWLRRAAYWRFTLLFLLLVPNQIVTTQSNPMANTARM
jgi:hypothetical protein